MIGDATESRYSTRLVKSIPTVRRAISAAIIVLGLMTPMAKAQEDFEAKIQNLINATERVRSQLKSEIPSSPEERSAGNGMRSFPSEPTAPQDPSIKASKIRERLQLLRRLRVSKAARSESSQQIDTAPRQQVAPPTVIDPNQRDTAPKASPKKLDIESQLEPKPMVANTQQDLSTGNATQVTPTAIDLVQLAETLFQTQNYGAALKSLQSIDTNQLSVSDENWVWLLSARCNQRLGNHDACDATLRKLANVESSDPLVAVARWWLKQNELTRDAIELAKALEDQYSTIVERTKGYETQQ